MNPSVVPEESERCTTVMAVLGRLIPGFSALIAGSFQVLILPAEDVGQRRPVELEAALDARQVVGHGDRAEGDRELEDRALHPRLVRGLQRRVGAGEVDGGRLEVGDAGAGADAVVVDRQALALEVGAPLLVDRLGQRRAGAVERGRAHLGAADPEDVPVDPPPPPALAELLLELLLPHAAMASAAANDTATTARRVVRTGFSFGFNSSRAESRCRARRMVLISCEPAVITCAVGRQAISQPEMGVDEATTPGAPPRA